MATGPNFSYGLRRLVDANQRFMRVAGPVYYRVRNFQDVQTQSWSQYGFAVSPSGSVGVGTTDVLIDPPPSVRMVSQHNIGMSEGRLRFGAREFIISHTWVLAQMEQLGFSDPTLIWRGEQAVGLVTSNLLCSIEQYIADWLSGDVVAWIILANCNELR